MNARSIEWNRAATRTPGAIGWAERGLLPDAIVRAGIRRLCAERLRAEQRGGVEAGALRFEERLRALRESALAICTDDANRQHYELPPAFFEACLGPRLKYSSCYYATGNESLAEAEAAMLALTAERADLADGQDILELGCGWGSLTLWMAERFPNARITAVSNSRSQRRHIEAACGSRGLRHVRVMTRDVNDLVFERAAFDRVVSVEMFEHVRNYEQLLARVASWMRTRARLFIHIFCHRTLMYPFDTDGDGDWMAQHFFTGGLMPSADTLLRFQRDLALESRWLVDGRHYARTASHWLERQDANRDAVLDVLTDVYGEGAPLWFQRWRMFWMACAELFGYRGGQEWMVAHYRFEKESLHARPVA
jgi:cyclopropane-fatty-acyl-phospholipid synthase